MNIDWQGIVFGLLVGFVYGIIFGIINYKLLQNTLKKADTQNFKRIFTRCYIIRAVINLTAFFIVFFLRNHLPWRFEFVLLGLVVALILPTRFLIFNVNSHEKSNFKEDKE